VKREPIHEAIVIDVGTRIVRSILRR